MSYTNLIADVPSFTARDDLTTAQLERFISLCEDKVSRMVRIAEMRSEVSQTAYCDPETTEVIFKTSGEVLEPVTIRLKDSTGATLRTYDQSPNNAFRETRRANSARPVWTPDPIAAIPATHYNGATYGGVTSSTGLTDTKGAVFCAAFNLRQLKNAIILRVRSASFSGFQVRLQAAGTIRLTTSSASAIQVNHVFTDLTVTAGAWHRLIITVDSENSAVQAYLDDTASADTPTFNNTDAMDFSVNNVTIGADEDGNDTFRGEITQLGLAQYPVDGSNALTTFFDASVAGTRARIFTAGATGIPVQYGTTRGEEIFEREATIWSPDGRPDRNYGTLTGFKVIDGLPNHYDTTDDFGSVSDLYGVLINPAIGDGTESVELTYYQEWPRLTSTYDTHWLVANHYDLYLYGCLAEAYDFLQNDAKEAAYREKFAGVAAAINRANQRKLRGTGPYIRRNSRRSTP